MRDQSFTITEVHSVVIVRIVIILFLIANSVYAQNTGAIKGFVTDSLTGESIPYATVQVLNTKLGTYSNVNGFYLLQNIPYGAYTIQISAVGYEKILKPIFIRHEEPLVVSIELLTSPIELKPVTKTADRLKEVYEANISAQAITQEEMNLIPIAIEKDIFKVFKVIPGISSTSDVTSQFYVRGGSGDQNLILFDNMMIYNPFHALGLFSIFNSDAIKVSEILTGGFGPEFGGRLSSVFNIISREGNKNRYSGKLSLGLLSGQGFVEGPSYNGSFLLSFRKSYFDQILNKMIGKDLPLSFYDITGKVTYDVSNDGKFYLTGIISNDKIENPNIADPNYSWNNSAFGITYLQTLGDRFIVNVSFSRSFFTGVMDPKNQDNKTKSESKISDLFFNSKVDVYLKNNDLLSIGFTFLLPETDFSFTNASGFFVKKLGSVPEADLWIKYKMVQIDNFIADLGLRNNLAKMQDQPGYAFEPRINLKYKIKDDLSLKGSIGRYHQMMITTSNEDDVIPLFETWYPLDADQNPEECDQYIFGMDGISFSENINLSLQGYYKNYKNILGYNLNKVDSYDPDFSLGTGKSYGIETFVKFHNDIFYGWLTYGLSWANLTLNNINYPPRYDKRHNLNLIIGGKIPYDVGINIHWEISSGLPFTPIVAYLDRLQYTGLFQGDFVNDQSKTFAILGDKNSKRLPLYHRLDMSFTKSFYLSEKSKMNIDLDLINLYNQKNIFYFNRQTGDKIFMLPFLPSISIGVEF